MKFYNQINPKLKNIVSHYWTTEGLIKSSQLLLPMTHIDIVIPLKGEFVFTRETTDYRINRPHVHGLNTTKTMVTQEDFAFTFGITFKAWGFYGLYGKSIHTFKDSIIPFNHVFESVVFDQFEGTSIENFIIKIEDTLLSLLIDDSTYESAIPILEAFDDFEGNKVSEFLTKQALSRRSLERMTKRYIGLSPKDFISIKQLNKAAKEMIFDENPNINQALYASDYYDESHLSRTLKKTTGHTPKSLADKKPSLKSHISYEE